MVRIHLFFRLSTPYYLLPTIYSLLPTIYSLLSTPWCQLLKSSYLLSKILPGQQALVLSLKLLCFLSGVGAFFPMKEPPAHYVQMGFHDSPEQARFSSNEFFPGCQAIEAITDGDLPETFTCWQVFPQHDQVVAEIEIGLARVSLW